MIKLLIQISYSAIFVLVNKMIYASRFDVDLIQRINVLSNIRVKNHGKIQIGRNVCVSKDCDILSTNGGYLRIGCRTFFNVRNIISCQDSIVIGDNCVFGPDVKIYDNDHEYCRNSGIIPGKIKTGSVNIGSNCWIGANAIILRGTTIEDNCVIGAGIVLKGCIPKNSLVSNSRDYKILKMK
jgi:acetyltransferase-like isoleucine patch superfamily enzyme